MSSKFLNESTGEENVKIGKYLAKIWPKYDSLVFLGHPVFVFLLFAIRSHQIAQRGLLGQSQLYLLVQQCLPLAQPSRHKRRFSFSPSSIPVADS